MCFAVLRVRPGLLGMLMLVPSWASLGGMVKAKGEAYRQKTENKTFSYKVCILIH